MIRANLSSNGIVKLIDSYTSGYSASDAKSVTLDDNYDALIFEMTLNSVGTSRSVITASGQLAGYVSGSSRVSNITWTGSLATDTVVSFNAEYLNSGKVYGLKSVDISAM